MMMHELLWKRFIPTSDKRIKTSEHINMDKVELQTASLKLKFTLTKRNNIS